MTISGLSSKTLVYVRFACNATGIAKLSDSFYILGGGLKPGDSTGSVMLTIANFTLSNDKLTLANAYHGGGKAASLGASYTWNFGDACSITEIVAF